VVLQVDPREFATILAALRFWQRTGLSCDHYGNGNDAGCLVLPPEENDIATDGSTLEPLGEDEIDELCERLNLKP
jgi:hypothetical protein